MSLQVKGLTVAYPKRLLFHEIDLKAGADEIVAIATCSQDGGTSLLKAIAGMLKGVTGSVQVNGREVLGRNDKALMHRIGFVYEAQGLISLLNVRDNITLPLRYFAHRFHSAISAAEIEARLIHLCDRLQLDREVLSMHPHRLNDVQIRLANLARAVIVEPDLLLIDELEGGMDKQLLSDTLATIRQFQLERPMPVLITAINPLVLELADRTYRIQEQNLVEDGP